MNRLESLGKEVFFVILGLVAIIVFIAAVIAGVGIISGLFLAVLVAIVIFLGSLGELASSIIIGYILKAFATNIHDFVSVWWSGNSADRFFSVVATTGYFKTMVVIFFFAYSISFFTRCVHIFRVRMGGSIVAKRG